VALAELCFFKDLGCRVRLRSPLRPDALVFGEDASRIVISYAPGQRAQVEAACKAEGAPLEEIGEVGGSVLRIEGVLEARVSELKEAWSGAIPRLVGEGIHKAALERVP
jgi:phosphoribosylformylglycinamidine synthase